MEVIDMFTHEQIVTACACFIYMNLNEELDYIDRLSQVARWMDDENEFELFTIMFDNEICKQWMLSKLEEV